MKTPTVTAALLFLMANLNIAYSQSVHLRPLPKRFYGITLTSINNMPEIIESISSFATMPITRVVFDEYIKPQVYRDEVNDLHNVSYIMGEILDSAYVSQYSVDKYLTRTIQYLNAFSDKVDIWEIGNEVNGEWLGNINDVVRKITGAYDIVNARNARTALTLYYNKNCWLYPSEKMFTWISQLPTRMKLGLDYVFISYYEQDCNNLQPDWQSVFNQLGRLFPNSKIGFGEVGETNKFKKAQYLKRYYKLNIAHPAYVGGHFWWYFNRDMVPKSKPMWTVLNNTIIELDAKTTSIPVTTSSAHIAPIFYMLLINQE